MHPYMIRVRALDEIPKVLPSVVITEEETSFGHLKKIVPYLRIRQHLMKFIIKPVRIVEMPEAYFRSLGLIYSYEDAFRGIKENEAMAIIYFNFFICLVKFYFDYKCVSCEKGIEKFAENFIEHGLLLVCDNIATECANYLEIFYDRPDLTMSHEEHENKSNDLSYIRKSRETGGFRVFKKEVKKKKKKEKKTAATAEAKNTASSKFIKKKINKDLAKHDRGGRQVKRLRHDDELRESEVPVETKIKIVNLQTIRLQEDFTLICIETVKSSRSREKKN